MKQVICLIPMLLMLVGCNNNYQSSSSDFASSQSSTPVYSSPKEAAPEIARTFVRHNYASDCKFENDVILENTMIENRYQVIQKFKNSNQEYIYKIFIQYFDGNVNDASSWDYGQLIVEDLSSHKQNYFKGNLESRIKKAVGIGNTVEFANVKFIIIDAKIGSSIAFSHKGKLTRKQIADALKEMHQTYGYENYHLYHENNSNEDYLCWMVKSAVFDYENNKIYETPDSFEQGKSIN